MADDRDILGKADALLRRHAPLRGPSDESDVPILTELITPGAQAGHEDPQTREFVAAVANAVHERLSRELERRLSQQLASDLHAAVAAALAELKPEIARFASEAVAQALARRPHR